MIVRRAQVEDAQQIGSLWYRLSLHHEPFHEYYRVREGGESELIKHARDLISRECICFVAEEDARIVGFVTGYIVRRNPQLLVEKVGKVDNIFVIPESRGKQIGSNLLGALTEFFQGQGVTFIEISCDIQNHDALRLYKRLGFEEQKTLLIKTLDLAE